MKRIIAGIILSLAAVSGAYAQTVNECDWVSSARNLVEPWSQNSRSFANGAIKVALLDVEEPVCCTAHLLVLSPHSEWGQSCHVISDLPGQGWLSIRYLDLKARYDAGLGLRVNIEVEYYDPETGTADPMRRARYGVRINQATGDVTLEN